jgi:hypothetical protein
MGHTSSVSFSTQNFLYFPALKKEPIPDNKQLKKSLLVIINKNRTRAINAWNNGEILNLLQNYLETKILNRLKRNSNALCFTAHLTKKLMQLDNRLLEQIFPILDSPIQGTIRQRVENYVRRYLDERSRPIPSLHHAPPQPMPSYRPGAAVLVACCAPIIPPLHTPPPSYAELFPDRPPIPEASPFACAPPIQAPTTTTPAQQSACASAHPPRPTTTAPTPLIDKLTQNQTYFRKMVNQSQSLLSSLEDAHSYPYYYSALAGFNARVTGLLEFMDTTTTPLKSEQFSIAAKMRLFEAFNSDEALIQLNEIIIMLNSAVELEEATEASTATPQTMRSAPAAAAACTEPQQKGPHSTPSHRDVIVQQYLQATGQNPA